MQGREERLGERAGEEGGGEGEEGEEGVGDCWQVLAGCLRGQATRVCACGTCGLMNLVGL